jgi:hypothetical protein
MDRKAKLFNPQSHNRENSFAIFPILGQTKNYVFCLLISKNLRFLEIDSFSFLKKMKNRSHNFFTKKKTGMQLVTKYICSLFFYNI